MQGPQNSQLRMIDPLDSLKKGLHTLRNQVQEWKLRIKSDQKASKVLSESDECHETMARAARLEHGFLVMQVRPVSNM